ncbi:24725_t:CDS:1, partial [Gigaspora rosea]
NNVSYDIIIRSFKKCGISNCLSGSEDYLIYENDSENSEDVESVNSSDEIEIDNEYESANENAGNNDDNANKDTENFDNPNNWSCWVVI